MAIFKKRPLAASCVALILAAALAYPLSVLHTALLMIPIAVAFLALLIFCIVRRFTYQKLFLLLLLLGVLLGGGRTLTERYRAERLFGDHTGQALTATIRIKEIESRGVYGSRLLADVREMDGEPCRSRVLLVTEGLTPLYLGDTVTGTFTCTELQEHSFYEGQEAGYRADGIYVAFVPADDQPLQLVKDGTNDLKTRLSDWRGALHHRLIAAVPGEEGELISALLLGTKDSLDNGTSLHFRRVGLSHLLALSGLHLAILAGVLELLFRLCRIGKRQRAVLLLCLLAFYWFLTGCSYSMLRAVLMFAILQLAFFSKGDYDAFTALCLGGACIVLATPCAIFDLSFQMTMLATFGILSFGELQGRLLRILPKKKGIAKRFWRLVGALISSLFITLAASVAILPIQWLIFGEISLLTPFANLLMIPMATGLLWLSLPLLPLSFCLPLAIPFGVPASLIAKGMLAVTEQLSQLPGMLSLNYAFVPYIFIPLFVLTALFLILDLKKLRGLTLAPMGAAVIAFTLCLLISHHQGAEHVDLIYRTTGRNDGLLMVQKGTAVICDVSNGSATQLYNDYKLLQTYCATEVEVLMLTHYHTRQVASIARFADFVMLRSLWLPTPQSDADKAILADLLLIAIREGITVTVYEHETPLTVFGAGSVILATPLREQRSVEPALDILITYGDTALTYQSAAYSEYARHAGVQERAIGEPYLILGGHGPVPHEEIAPPIGENVREIVFSNEATLMQWRALYDLDRLIFSEIVTYRLE